MSTLSESLFDALSESRGDNAIDLILAYPSAPDKQVAWKVIDTLATSMKMTVEQLVAQALERRMRGSMSPLPGSPVRGEVTKEAERVVKAAQAMGMTHVMKKVNDKLKGEQRGMRESLFEDAERGGSINVCSVDPVKAREYAQGVMGKSLDEVVPEFDANLLLLKSRCAVAMNISRNDMPVIEPSDMAKFAERLSSGHVDIFAPYANGKLYVPKDIDKDEGSEWVTLGVKDGNKTDDVIPAKMMMVAARDMKPTQSEIWLEKLVGYLAKHGKPAAGSPVTKATTIMSKDGYILDGHHRWGQAMLGDPDVKLSTLYVPMSIQLLLKIGRTYGNAIGNRQKA